MSFSSIRHNAKWLSLLSGIVFLAINVYMRIKFVFESGNTGGMLLLISLVALFFALVCGILALPRWQGFVALGICIYGGYWIAYYPPYAVS
jgi:hypothetical protein